MVTAPADKTTRVHLATRERQGGHIEAGARRLHGLFQFRRDDTQLAGYRDEMLEIEVCARIE